VSGGAAAEEPPEAGGPHRRPSSAPMGPRRTAVSGRWGGPHVRTRWSSGRIDADGRACGDRLDHELGCAGLAPQVTAGALRRRIRQWLRTGVWAGATLSAPERGSLKGGVRSPRWAQLVLEPVWDAWCERDVTPRLQGRGVRLRWADDGVMGGEREDEARRRLAGLPKRWARCTRPMHPPKSCLARTAPQRGPSPAGILGAPAAAGPGAGVACAAGGGTLVPRASARPAAGTIPRAVPEAPRARSGRRCSGDLSDAGSALSERRARMAVVAEPAWGAAAEPRGDVRHMPRRAAVAHTPSQTHQLRCPAGPQQCCTRAMPRRWCPRHRRRQSRPSRSVGRPVGHPPALPGSRRGEPRG
jgi:hypothetical protein